jgi:adenylyl-sulfate kinase
VNDYKDKSSGIVLWFTGLSGSGKTTVAKGLIKILESKSISSIVLDGDEIRNKRNSSLGFTERDIKLNNALIVELCLKERLNHRVVIVPIISPYSQSRNHARSVIGEGFNEIYFSASLECVIKRDVKGLYAKSARKKIKNLIGVASSNPYEPPCNPDLIINTEKESIRQSIECLYKFIISLLINRN